eukprot:COSAG04_NODE_986_length_8993_cov_4.156510_1_plen_71_part_10
MRGGGGAGGGARGYAQLSRDSQHHGARPSGLGGPRRARAAERAGRARGTAAADRGPAASGERPINLERGAV